MSLALHEPRRDPASCDHEDIEPFGGEREARFYRCIACESVLIAQAGHLWVLRGPPGPENQDFTF